MHCVRGRFLALLMCNRFLALSYLGFLVHITQPSFFVLVYSRCNQFQPLKPIAPFAYDVSTAVTRPPIEEKNVQELLDLGLFDCEKLITFAIITACYCMQVLYSRRC